jgi:hypothetical protein
VSGQAPQYQSPYPVVAAVKPMTPAPAQAAMPPVYPASPYSRAVNAAPAPALPKQPVAASVDYVALLNPAQAANEEVWPLP